MTYRLPLVLAVALGLVGCGSTHPSLQINNARTALNAAKASEEGRRVPAELLTATRTLEEAERAQEDQPDSQEVLDLAYIADRQIRVALAHGGQMALREQATRDQAIYQRDLENSSRETRERLTSTQGQLAASGAQVTDQAHALQAQGEALDSERQARVAAEQRAAEAMTRLTALASVRQQQNETVITILGALLFRSGGSTLLPAASERLVAVAEAIAAQPDRTVTVHGYTDSTGSLASNEELSRARAEGVRAFLIAHAVPAARVTAIGSGPANPVADNATAEGRANNRRVEIVLGASAPGTTVTTTTTRN